MISTFVFLCSRLLSPLGPNRGFNSPSLHASRRHVSSVSAAQWASRQSRDPFVKQRGTYRSRAAFKLMDIIEGTTFSVKRGKGSDDGVTFSKGPLLSRGMVVVDCGAAPGGWTQVAAEYVVDPKLPLSHPANGHVISIDLLALTPPDSIPGSTFLQMDMTKPETLNMVREVVRRHRLGVNGQTEQDVHRVELRNDSSGSEPNNLRDERAIDPDVKPVHVDAVISDMAPNISGLRAADTARSAELCRFALDVAVSLFSSDPSRPTVFICKSFGGHDEDGYNEGWMQTKLRTFLSSRHHSMTTSHTVPITPMTDSNNREHRFDRLLQCQFVGPSPRSEQRKSPSAFSTTPARPDVRRFTGRIPAEFALGGIPFGGFLLALTLSVLNADLEKFPAPPKPGKENKDREISGLQVAFLEGGKQGNCWVDVWRVREGGSIVSEGVMGQGNDADPNNPPTELLRFFATYDVLPRSSDTNNEDHITDVPPSYPPLESSEFAKLRDHGERWNTFGGLVERVSLPFPPLSGPFSNLPEVRYALRIPGRPADAMSVALFSDAFSTPLRRIPEINAREFRGLTLDAHLRFRSSSAGLDEHILWNVSVMFTASLGVTSNKTMITHGPPHEAMRPTQAVDQILPEELLHASLLYLSPSEFFNTIPLVSRRWNGLAASMLGESGLLAAEVELSYVAVVRAASSPQTEAVGPGQTDTCKAWKCHSFNRFRPLKMVDGGKALAVVRLGLRALPSHPAGDLVNATASRLIAEHFPNVAPLRRGVRGVITFVNVGFCDAVGLRRWWMLEIGPVPRPSRVLGSVKDFVAAISRSGNDVGKNEMKLPDSVRRVDIRVDLGGDANLSEGIPADLELFPKLQEIAVHGGTRSLIPIAPGVISSGNSTTFANISTLMLEFTNGDTPQDLFRPLLLSALSAFPNLRRIGDFHVFDKLWESFLGRNDLKLERQAALENHIEELTVIGHASLRYAGGSFMDKALAMSHTLGWLFPYTRLVSVMLADYTGVGNLCESPTLIEMWTAVVAALPSSVVRFRVKRLHMPEARGQWMDTRWRSVFLPAIEKAGRAAGKRMMVGIEGEDD
ncbi:hypothetical protein HDU93_007463 [Gonapodya sp. JEL0774]|nr:hypothetical protein HDU93_007463 [Gonapodya sp. JEL0774]